MVDENYIIQVDFSGLGQEFQKLNSIVSSGINPNGGSVNPGVGGGSSGIVPVIMGAAQAAIPFRGRFGRRDYTGVFRQRMNDRIKEKRQEKFDFLEMRAETARLKNMTFEERQELYRDRMVSGARHSELTEMRTGNRFPNLSNLEPPYINPTRNTADSLMDNLENPLESIQLFKDLDIAPVQTKQKVMQEILQAAMRGSIK